MYDWEPLLTCTSDASTRLFSQKFESDIFNSIKVIAPTLPSMT